jgi:glycosyl transferase family 11
VITFTDLGLFSYLGNELFQYAALLGVAERRGFDARLPPAAQHRLGTLIELDTPTYTTEELRSLRYRFAQIYPAYGYEPALEEIPDGCDVNGYFQSRRHFPEQLRDSFRLREDVRAQVEAIWSRLNPVRPVVGFHVRRGDAVGSGHWLPLTENGYLERAKAHFAEMDVDFLVVSDDPQWCADHLAGPDTVIAEPAGSPIHLALLARCDHLLIANSTFSWWAAWFQKPRGGIVVAPEAWYYPGTFDNDEQDVDPDWILL